MTKRYVAYLRVSTQRQGRSGLGLEAQRAAVLAFVNGNAAIVVQHVEIESGAKSDRPQLAAALAACRLHNATLVVAKLDRLARDAHFLLGLQKAGVRFVACDMPDANEMTVGLMAVIAQGERAMISQRTKAALAAAKARGVKLGGDRGNIAALASDGAKASARARSVKVAQRAADLKPILDDLRAAGAASLRELAAGLDARGIPAPRGGGWSPTAVRRVLARG